MVIGPAVNPANGNTHTHTHERTNIARSQKTAQSSFVFNLRIKLTRMNFLQFHKIHFLLPQEDHDRFPRYLCRLLSKKNFNFIDRHHVYTFFTRCCLKTGLQWVYIWVCVLVFLYHGLIDIMLVFHLLLHGPIEMFRQKAKMTHKAQVTKTVSTPLLYIHVSCGGTSKHDQAS